MHRKPVKKAGIKNGFLRRFCVCLLLLSKTTAAPGLNQVAGQRTPRCIAYPSGTLQLQTSALAADSIGACEMKTLT